MKTVSTFSARACDTEEDLGEGGSEEQTQMTHATDKDLRDKKNDAALLALTAIFDELKSRMSSENPDESLREALKKMSAPDLLKLLNRTITAIKEPASVRVQVGPSRLPAPDRLRVKDIESQVMDPEKESKALERQRVLLEKP